MNNSDFQIGDYVYVALPGGTANGKIIGIRPGDNKTGEWLYTVDIESSHVSVFGKRLSYTL